MNRIELEIGYLQETHSKNQSYAVILVEKEGKRRLPVIIGSTEAQAIAVVLENFKPSRPLTHDLFVSFVEHFDVKVEEVVISDLKNGIFYALIQCSKDGETFEIDSRTSDAIALALRVSCPIYVNEHVMAEAGFVFGDEEETLEEEGQKTELVKPSKAVKRSGQSLDDLEQMLREAIEREDYEAAARIRDDIDRLKGNS